MPDVQGHPKLVTEVSGAGHTRSPARSECGPCGTAPAPHPKGQSLLRVGPLPGPLPLHADPKQSCDQRRKSSALLLVEEERNHILLSFPAAGSQVYLPPPPHCQHLGNASVPGSAGMPFLSVTCSSKLISLKSLGFLGSPLLKTKLRVTGNKGNEGAPRVSPWHRGPTGAGIFFLQRQRGQKMARSENC